LSAGVGLLVENVVKQFAGDSGALLVLDHLSLCCRPGEFVSILGPSGAGKTTLLRLIAGLDTVDSGRIAYTDNSLNEVDPSSVRIGMVFQEPRLLPWASVAANIRYGLQDRAAQMSKSEQEYAVAELIERTGLSGFESYLPHQISGGMAQRAALARALVGDPNLLLLDEPLGSLDIKNRLAIQDLLANVVCAGGSAAPTCVMVTHSVDEALYLSDRVYVLSERPAAVIAEVDVPVARPRDRASTGFFEAKRQILSALGVSSSP